MGIYAIAKNEDDVNAAENNQSITRSGEGFKSHPFYMEWSVFSIMGLISFEVCPFSSIGSSGSAHASLWDATGIVSSGEGVEIVVL